MTENIFFDKSKLKRCGKNVIIGKTVRIRSPEKVSIGDNVIIDDFTYISGQVTIGDYVHVACNCVLAASQGTIEMKSFSGLSAGCKVYAGSSNYVTCGLDIPTIPVEYQYNTIIDNVVLESFALVGANGTVLPGATLPEGFAMAANLIVRKKLKLNPWSLMVNDEGKQIKRKGVKELHQRVNQFYKIDFKHSEE